MATQDAVTSAAQTIVPGRIVDGQDAPVAYANVQLLNTADSTVSYGTVADERGRFAVQDDRRGCFLIFVFDYEQSFDGKWGGDSPCIKNGAHALLSSHRQSRMFTL